MTLAVLFGFCGPSSPMNAGQSYREPPITFRLLYLRTFISRRTAPFSQSNSLILTRWLDLSTQSTYRQLEIEVPPGKADTVRIYPANIPNHIFHSADQHTSDAIFSPQSLGPILPRPCKGFPRGSYPDSHQQKDESLLSDRAHAPPQRRFLPRRGKYTPPI